MSDIDLSSEDGNNAKPSCGVVFVSLYQPTSCKPDTCQELHWFPGVFIHGFGMNPAADLSNLLRYCDPLNAERRQLVKRLLLDLGLDADNTTEADVKGLRKLICTRCDPNTATYLSFAQIAKHYIVVVDHAKKANLVFSDHD